MFNSWVFRLAEANGFSDVREFIFAYFYPNNRDKGQFYYEYSLFTDYRDNLYHFWRALPDGILPSELILNLTTFPITAPFMSKEQRQRYLCQSFYGDTNLGSLFSFTHGTTQKLRICPRCAEIELEKFGEFYLHRIAQSPAITLCPHHWMDLQEIDYRNLKTLKELPVMEPSRKESVNILDMMFSAFCENFFEAKHDFSVDTVAELLDYGLKGEGTFKERLNAFLEKQKEEPEWLSIIENIDMNLPGIGNIKKWDYVSADKLLALLGLIYLGSDAPPREMTDIPEGEAERFTLFAGCHGYKLLSPYRRDVVSLRHEDCGTVFVVSPYGFEIGWRCPTCIASRTQDEQFRILVDNIGKGEYVPRSTYVSNDKPVAMYHSVCGQEFNIKPRAFLYENTRCRCESSYTFSAASEIVARNEGFKLIKFNGALAPAVFEHSCGAQFTVAYSKFLKSPFCRVCERDDHHVAYTDDDFKKRIKELTGDEYELVGHYVNPKTKVQLRHNVCGTVQEYKPFFFLDGGRCRKCGIRNIPEKDFINYVKEFTKGRYEITARPTVNLYEVTDTVTGSKVRMGRLKVIQELTRPTPSDLLPYARDWSDTSLSNINLSEQRNSIKSKDSADYLYDTLREMYPGDDRLIYWDDVIAVLVKPDAEKYTNADALYGDLQILMKRKKIIKLALQIFTFPSELFTPGDIIKYKYLIRDGKHIGFYRGPQFAREIGFSSIAVKDHTWHIETNMESSKATQRKTTFIGEDIHIKGCQYTIDNSNWVILSVLDFLVQYKQVVKEDEEIVLEKVRKFIRENNNGELYCYNDFKPYMNYKAKNIVTIMDRLIGRLVDAESTGEN